MKFAADIVLEKEMTARSTAAIAWAVASDSFVADNATKAFEARGHSRYLPHVKAAVDPMLSTDPGLADPGPLVTAFLGLVNAQSLLGQLVGATRLPLTAVARLQLGTIVASRVRKGDPKPVARMDFALNADTPTKVVAELIVSAEAQRSLDPETQSGVTAALVSAAADATNVEVVAILTSGSPNGSSAVGDLFAAVSGGNPRRPYLVAGFDALLGLPSGVLRDLQSLGVVILPTAAASNLLIALDAAGTLIADGGAEISTARHAHVLLDDGIGSPAGSSTISLWQGNLAALRCERWFRLAVRDGAVAFANVGSPA